MTRSTGLVLIALVPLALAGCSANWPQPGVGESAAADTDGLDALTPTHWVATSGNDNWPGTQAQPWRTLGHAAESIVAGDVVQVLPGSYQGFYLETAGTQGHRIIFRGRVGQGAWVVINQANGRTPDGINVENSGWAVIQGFSVDAMPRAGIRVAVSPHVTVRRCRCRDNQTWGIFAAFANHVLIQGNLCSGSQDQHGIYVSNSGDYPIVRGNTCSGNRGCGIHCNADASMGGDGVISHALFERNVVRDNGTGGGSGINCDGVCDSVIRNNLVHGNHASGISLYHIDGAVGSKRNQVVNNTVVQAPDGRWCLNINSSSTGNIVRNNILLHTLSYRGSLVIDRSSRAGFSSDYNLVSGPFSANGDSTLLNLSQWQSLGYDAHSAITTAALVFIDPAAGNYRPKPGGPAIDTGDPAYAPRNDLLGRSRPQGVGYDIGCYEGP